MIRAVLFDVDDTLYDEAMFVRSGFSAVAEELARRGVADPDGISALFCHIHFEEGRERVFNKAAVRIGFDEGWIADLVRIYREHEPQLDLFEEVPSVLGTLRENYRLGCVTDGWFQTQQNKVTALGLHGLVDEVVLSDEFGRAFWKPHARPFHACCERLGVEPGEAVFVGDNPERDVQGARDAGLISVRLRRQGAYFAGDDAFQPHHEIGDLHELVELLAREGTA